MATMHHFSAVVKTEYVSIASVLSSTYIIFSVAIYCLRVKVEDSTFSCHDLYSVNMKPYHRGLVYLYSILVVQYDGFADSSNSE